MVALHPLQEIDCGLVPFCDRKFGLLLWLFGGSGCGNITRNGDTSLSKIICNVPDLEINVNHFTELLCRLLVVASLLGIELNPVVAVLPLTMISSKVRKVRLKPYESTVVIVGCPEHLDAGDVIPKKMKFDGLEAECPVLATS